MDSWRKDYNERRPHSALGNRTPQELSRLSLAFQLVPSWGHGQWGIHSSLFL
ncbi:transposase [Gimesia chilikensis]|nr:transposase [Gimesia chilikensis]